MRFDRVLIIGSGNIATDCVRILTQELGLRCVEVLESASSRFSMLEHMCTKGNVPYAMALKKETITETILRAADDGCRLLIVSANNRYLFPPEICDLPGMEIINFHYGYLPRYRGMNIPTWTIYNNEPYTGVTWHYVTAQVDQGEIITQRKIPLNDTITAYEVVREGMRIGTELFRAFIPELLDRRISGTEIVTEERVYLNKCLPQDGVIDLDRPIPEIYRLLRSFDYGRAETLRPLELSLNGANYIVTGYSLAGSGEEERTLQFQEDSLTLSEKGKRLEIRLKKHSENDIPR